MTKQKGKTDQGSTLNPEYQRLSAQYRALQRLGFTLNLDEVLHHVADAMMELTNAERGFVVLIGDDKITWQHLVTRNIGMEMLHSYASDAKTSLIHQVIELGQPAVTTDELPEAYSSLSDTKAYSSRTIMCAPLPSPSQIIGAVYVDRSAQAGLFSPSDLEMLNAFAEQAAKAIHNARLYSQVNRTQAECCEELERLKQALQEVNQAKSKFISVVSHELRVPLTSIKGFADLLRHGAAGPISEQQAGFLDVIRNSVERMSALISDLSDLSMIEAGCLKVKCDFLDLGRCVEEVLHTIRPKLKSKKQTLELNLASNVPKVYADANRVNQILMNLLTNAWQYTSPGGRLRVSVFAEGNFVRVEVKDSGIGISPHDQQSVFLPFFRSEDPLVRNEQGWGLGLSVAKGLVELLGGKIGYHSVLGEGSTFWFTLRTEIPTQ